MFLDVLSNWKIIHDLPSFCVDKILAERDWKELIQKWDMRHCTINFSAKTAAVKRGLCCFLLLRFVRIYSLCIFSCCKKTLIILFLLSSSECEILDWCEEVRTNNVNPAMFVRVEFVGYYFLIISRQRDVTFGQLNTSDQDIVFKYENILLIGNNFMQGTFLYFHFLRA